MFDGIRIEILKYQEQDKEAEQNRQIIKTKTLDGREPPMKHNKITSAEK